MKKFTDDTKARFFNISEEVKVKEGNEAFYSIDNKGRIALYLNDKKVAQIQKGATDKASKIVVYTSYRLTLNDKTKEQSLDRLTKVFLTNKNIKASAKAKEVIINPSYERKGKDQFYSKIDFEPSKSIEDIETTLIALALRTPYYNPLAELEDDEG